MRSRRRDLHICSHLRKDYLHRNQSEKLKGNVSVYSNSHKCLCANSITLMWHLLPWYPFVHWQEYPPMWSIHCPPFMHGFDSHSLYSKLHKSPEKPDDEEEELCCSPKKYEKKSLILPGWQKHLNPSSWSTQMPCTHGEDSHSFKLCWHKGPA